MAVKKKAAPKRKVAAKKKAAPKRKVAAKKKAAHRREKSLLRRRQHRREKSLRRRRQHRREKSLRRRRQHRREKSLLRRRQHRREKSLLKRRQHRRERWQRGPARSRRARNADSAVAEITSPAGWPGFLRVLAHRPVAAGRCGVTTRPLISPTFCCGRRFARCDEAYSLRPLFHLVSATPAPSFTACTPSQRHLAALATKPGEINALAAFGENAVGGIFGLFAIAVAAAVHIAAKLTHRLAIKLHADQDTSVGGTVVAVMEQADVPAT